MGTPLRVIVADDHALFRDGLKSVLALQPDVTVVGEAERVDELMLLLARTPCDILLLDLGMERSSLIDIESLVARVCVVVVTASESAGDAVEAIRAGARAVVFKRFAAKTLMEAIHAAARGQVWMPPSLQTHLAAGLREPARNPISPREREIIRHVALGACQ